VPTRHKIRANSVLPARREPITLTTVDGLHLVGEVARPADGDPVATMLCLPPLPTHGGMMDSHVLRKVSFRLPALADLAVLRFNTRGTSSERGTSAGEFGEGDAERVVDEGADAGAGQIHHARAVAEMQPAGRESDGRPGRCRPTAVASGQP